MASSTLNGEMPLNVFRPRPLPLGYTKHHVVHLEGIWFNIPELPFPHTFEVYQRTAPEEIVDRIKSATIVISNVCEVKPSDAEQAPHLQLLLILATGMGWVDKAYYAKKGITVMNTPSANIDAVSEHFVGLYFASRKRMNTVDRLVRTSSEWQEKVTMAKVVFQGPPLACKQETLGIVGYGALGHRIEELARALYFKEVLISERKGSQKVRPGRVSFDELVQRCTTIVIACPREADTVNLFDETELRRMRKDSLLINVGRGGIVNEAALATALKEGWILGAATDVFDIEPNGPGGSPLLPDVRKGEKEIPNLLVTPHIAWYSETTLQNIISYSTQSMKAFVEGRVTDAEISHRIAVHEGKIWK